MQQTHSLDTTGLEQAIKFFINEQLFIKGYISEELYKRAKLVLLKSEQATYEKAKTKVS